MPEEDAALQGDQSGVEPRAQGAGRDHVREHGVATGVQQALVQFEADAPDTAQVLSRLLRREGHVVTHAGGVRLAIEAASNDEFDVLMSDVGLPDGTGYELMRKLKAAGRRLRGIAVSGYGSEADIRQSLDAGNARIPAKCRPANTGGRRRSGIPSRRPGIIPRAA